MTENMHTPGPWTIDLGGEGYMGEYRIAEFDSARAYKRGGVDAVRAEDEANARLIAAAPDLLAALETLLANATITATGDYARVTLDDLYAARAAARAARGKATGGDPILCPRCEGDTSQPHNGHGEDCLISFTR
jgi:hypothetical protein